jgi:hypothetical protein
MAIVTIVYQDGIEVCEQHNFVRIYKQSKDGWVNQILAEVKEGSIKVYEQEYTTFRRNCGLEVFQQIGGITPKFFMQ